MKYTIKAFRNDFPDEDSCLEYLFRSRFPEAKGYNHEKGTKRYTHQNGYKHISPMAGTIFENSSTPLSLWFHAIYLFSVSKNGVSSKELQRQLGVTYKTAWRMSKQIRKLIQQDDDKLNGIVEIDESFISKTSVLGAVERGGRVRVKVSKDMTGASIARHVIKNIAFDAKIMSDNNKAYAWLDRHFDRKFVTHKKQYVLGNVHVNSMESFWSNTKRSIAGTYHYVSPKHLQSYLDFFSFHYEYRNSSLPPFLALLGMVCQ